MDAMTCMEHSVAYLVFLCMEVGHVVDIPRKIMYTENLIC